MPFTIRNVVIGVVCIVVVSVLFALFQGNVYDPPLPTWLEQALVTLVAVLIWFSIAPRLNR